MAVTELASTPDFLHLQIHHNVTSPVEGEWIDVGPYWHGYIHYARTTSFTITVRGSNKATKPLPSDDGVVVHTRTTTGLDASVGVPLPRWIRVDVDAVTDPMWCWGKFLVAVPILEGL